MMNKNFKKLDKCSISKAMTKKLGKKLQPLECWRIKKSIDESFEFIMFSDMQTIYFLYNQT